jgi:hypothetical protein
MLHARPADQQDANTRALGGTHTAEPDAQIEESSAVERVEREWQMRSFGAQLAGGPDDGERLLVLLAAGVRGRRGKTELDGVVERACLLEDVGAEFGWETEEGRELLVCQGEG